MKTSSAQIDRIKSYESFSSTSYNDPPGSATYSIGYGHQIQPGEPYMSEDITEDQATNLLAGDVAPLEDQINTDLNADPSQNQFDSLVDFGFNCGSGALAKVIDTWNSTSSTTAVTAEIAEYNKITQGGVHVVSKTLDNRRQDEISNFNSVIPPLPTSVKTGLLGVALLIVLCWAVC